MFVKVCGTTSEADALLAVACGADAVGFIFAPSTRQVQPGAVADIVKRLPTDVLTVGVFRDHSARQVIDIVRASGLGAAQLQGRETPAVAAEVRRAVGRIILALPAGDVRVPRAAEWGADFVMLDAAAPGSGQVFDWSLAADVPAGQRVLLAGGLTAENVTAAVAAVRPFGVDVATGVEASPGRKDPRKLRAFIVAARAAAEVLPAAARSAGSDPAGTQVDPYDWRDDG